MLQQTTVAAVIPYYERFLRRFPTIESLARASEASVLKLWAGLGYYSRARNLRRAAQEIMRRHGGVFPEDPESVLALPGIGRYTAGAILSIAFSKPLPVVDGNVIRVFSRLLALRGSVKDQAWQRRLWDTARTFVPLSRPGDWNQALMELGATVCLPENPRCAECAVATVCAARRLGLVQVLPEIPRRPTALKLSWTCLWIEDHDRVLLWKRSPDERLLKGLWGLPESRHLRLEPGALLRRARHSITRHQITVEVRSAPPPKRLPSAALWVPKKRLADYLVSSLWFKCLPDKGASKPPAALKRSARSN